MYSINYIPVESTGKNKDKGYIQDIQVCKFLKTSNWVVYLYRGGVEELGGNDMLIIQKYNNNKSWNIS